MWNIMRVLRAAADVLTLGPIAGIIGYAVTKAGALSLAARGGTETPAPQLAFLISVALFCLALGVLSFMAGVTLHWFVARRSRKCPRHVWYVILAGSSAALFLFPAGTIIGGVTIILLFTLPTFQSAAPGLPPA